MPDSTAITSANVAAYASFWGESTAARDPVKTLGQDDFLKLLITQMSVQDPLNPKKDTDFLAQMAQFSALEQSRAVQTELARLHAEQQFVQANDLIGRNVELQIDPETTLLGTVDAMRVEAGTPKIVVNGQGYELSQVLTVALAQPQS